ncbi:MAG: dihydroorotase [Rhodospirillales bacterium]|nr:dihydroorotase [Rhodospirillales bacterium]
MAASTEITLRRPDDWHVHLRDGAMLNAVAPITARAFARAIVMPNLVDPVTTAAAAGQYRERILDAVGRDGGFTPLMTCYLTDRTDAEDLCAGHADGVFTAAKLYPAGATTNSASGVTDMARIRPVLEAMQETAMPLLIHGEVTDPEVDVFDREAVFIERVLTPLLADFPALRVVFEHITTADAVAFVRAQGPRVAATVTVHHLLINRTDLFRGGIRPHLYCLPVAKREAHRLALVEAATSGEGCFFLGTDSAPHPVADKESACGCAGIFSAPAALELYAQVFADQGVPERLEAFAALNGPAFYGLPVNEGTVTLKREDWTVPDAVPVAVGGLVRPFMGGEVVGWKVAD